MLKPCRMMQLQNVFFHYMVKHSKTCGVMLVQYEMLVLHLNLHLKQSFKVFTAFEIAALPLRLI